MWPYVKLSTLRPCRALLTLDTQRNFIQSSMIFSSDSLNCLLSQDTSCTAKWKKPKKLSLHSTSSIAPQISFSISSPKLTKPIELRKRWGLQRRNSFLQGVFQAHLHYTVVLSWDRKSIQNVNLLIMGVYKRQWKHCGVKKQNKKVRQWMLPAVSICTSVLAKGLPSKRKIRYHGLPVTNMY